MFWRDHVPLIYFSSVVNTCDYTRQEVVGAVECQWLCYSTSAKNPATRAGAVGELKGFRRRSPAAADGNELNMSGCLGTGASEKYGCCSASSAEILLSGSYVNRDDNRSIPATVKNGIFCRN